MTNDKIYDRVLKNKEINMKNRIIINVEGGVVKQVNVDNKEGVTVVVFDNDNLEAEGLTSDQRDEKWAELIKGTETVY